MTSVVQMMKLLAQRMISEDKKVTYLAQRGFRRLGGDICCLGHETGCSVSFLNLKKLNVKWFINSYFL